MSKQKQQRDSSENRIRVALGVTPDEPMPRVDLYTLRRYHDHLAVSLSFPYEGRLSGPIGPHRDIESPLSVIRLMGPVKEYEPEEMYGLICKADQNGERIELPLDHIEVEGDSPNRQLLDDYRSWVHTWG